VQQTGQPEGRPGGPGDTEAVTPSSEHSEGMSLAEVLNVLEILSRAGCKVWLEGGWGVDALVGRQTRVHRDVDIDIDGEQEGLVLDALIGAGYRIETDWRPNRVELVAGGRGRVDVHPLQLHADGSASQVALDGGSYFFPRGYFTMGSLAGRPVPCFSVAAQRHFRSGYDLRPQDVHDLALLEKLDATDSR
jgi:lincosamide nucleotidyltransferase A/C/D/E